MKIHYLPVATVAVAVAIAFMSCSRPLPVAPAPLSIQALEEQKARCKTAGFHAHEIEAAWAIVEVRCVVPGTRLYVNP